MRSLPYSTVLLILVGCAAGGLQVPSRAPTPAPREEAPPPSRSVRWMSNSAEYQAVCRQTYAAATERLRQLAVGKGAGTWAVAADADETVISNIEYDRELRRKGEESTPEAWDGWVARRAAPPIPGAIEFLELVHELGGRVAIVTNRLEQHCADTRANFHAFDIPFDVMLCRTEDREKEPRWEEVQAGTASGDLPPLEIVLWIGDNIRDFPGLDQELRFADGSAFVEFGRRFFIVPNPMYGSWLDNPEE